MQRVPETELMDGRKQAKAYAAADFSEPNKLFISLLNDFCTAPIKGDVLDLGCGPADICIRFAQIHPECCIHGVDGSRAMLDLATKSINAVNLGNRISLIEGLLPQVNLLQNHYATILSNSLLHHLPDPLTLWETVTSCGKKGAAILVMDLIRPRTRGEAGQIVEHYAKDEPDVLKKDFYNSLLAAYRIDEVEEQLRSGGLRSLRVEQVSDRHLGVKGYLP